MRRIILIASCALLASGSVQAFDAAPSPKVKTLAWTIEKALVQMPTVELKSAPGSGIVKLLSNSESSFGFYLDLDVSEVEGRLEREMSYVAKDVSYLELIGVLADLLDADVVISPGKVKLVPRKAVEKKEEG